VSNQELKGCIEFQKVLDTTKQEVRKMIEQVQETSGKKLWVENFDEEDWKELLRQDLWEPSEQDKVKLRVD
jgi:hypothetical protein